MSKDRHHELKNQAREFYRKAESEKAESDKNLMRSRHHLDSAEAAFQQAEEEYQEAKALNEKARESLDKAKAKFLETFGEEP